MQLASFPLMAVIVWLLARHQPELARRAARLLAVMAITLFLVIVASGFALPAGGAASLHPWCGHALVIAAWLGVPFSAGVILQQAVQRRPVAAIGQVVALLLLLGLVLLASATGYLRQSQNVELDEAAGNRFQILHVCALPVLQAMLLGAWCWFLRRRNHGAATRSAGAEAA